MRESTKVSHFFVDRYIEIIHVDDHPEFKKEIREDFFRLNRILQRENLRNDWEGTLIINQEQSDEKKGNSSEIKGDEGIEEIADTKISNFCVIPTHRLYVKNESRIFEDGIGVKVVAKISKNKYKCIYLNLTNEMIEKGFWVSPFFLDHDLYLYNKNFYNQLKIAIKLSTRILSSAEFKIFDGEWWLENHFSDVDISDFEGFPKTNRNEMLAHPLTTHGEIKSFNSYINNEMTSEIMSRIKQDIYHFLQAINELVKRELILDKGVSPDVDSENIGWKDDNKYYLLYGKTWKWIENFLHESKYQISMQKKEFDIMLYEEGIIEIEEEKTGRKRADFQTNVYPGKNKRVFRIFITRLNEFIDTYDGLENQ